MDAHDRQEALRTLDRAAIDQEFLPYLDRINACPLVASQQCCIGHMKYEGQFTEQPENQSGRWGYLQLLMNGQLAEWLMEQSSEWHWLWIPCSQLWAERALTPGMTDNDSILLTFAWDAAHWSQPAEDICGAIERFWRGHKGCQVAGNQE
jgi:hypothetical protein